MTDEIERVSLHRLRELEAHWFPKLPDNQLGRDLRATVREVIREREVEAATAAYLEKHPHPAA